MAMCLGILWRHSHSLPGDLAWGSYSETYLGTCSTSSVLLGTLFGDRLQGSYLGTCSISHALLREPVWG